MSTLYSVQLSTHKRGHVTGPVKCLSAVYAGHYRKAERGIVKPDMTAVRACLPHYYRKAFDRTGGTAWFPDDSDKPAHMTLRDSRGKYLNTVYLQPYDFTA